MNYCSSSFYRCFIKHCGGEALVCGISDRAADGLAIRHLVVGAQVKSGDEMRSAVAAELSPKQVKLFYSPISLSSLLI
ncbi:hypothetical protein LN893_19770 [Pontibacter sp. XAAS-A31]|nr:hypothetical protein [Pontibacter harenae]